jgi:hypothetical protein
VTTAQDQGSRDPDVILRGITVAAVVVVGLIAAVVSYSHMVALGIGAGESWRSYLIPVSIDGLMVAASMVLVIRRRAGLSASGIAWGALIAGVLASLGANMADARPEVTAVLYAGWAPVALAVGFELLLQQRRAKAPEVAAPVVEASAPVVDTPAPTPIEWSPKISEGSSPPAHIEAGREPVKVQRLVAKTPLRLAPPPPGRRSPVRAAAVAHLAKLTPAQRAAITAADLAKAIKAKPDTCRRGLPQWRLDAANESEQAV